MNRSGSQKALLVISIINIVLGILALILSIMGFVPGTTLSAAGPIAAEEAGLTVEETAVAAGLFSGISMVGIISSILEIIVGVLGIRAANDASKIMPVWIIALIEVVSMVIAIVMSLVNKNFEVSSLLSLAVGCLMFWIANNIKNQN